jgi:hypothetical protein
MGNSGPYLVLMRGYGDASRPVAFDASNQIASRIHSHRKAKLTKSLFDEAIDFLLETAGRVTQHQLADRVERMCVIFHA